MGSSEAAALIPQLKKKKKKTSLGETVTRVKGCYLRGEDAEDESGRKKDGLRSAEMSRVGWGGACVRLSRAAEQGS